MLLCCLLTNDSELVVDDLGEGCQAVGGAGRVGDDGHVLGVALVVHSHHEHGRVVLGRRRDHDLAGGGLASQMLGGSLNKKKKK